MKIHNKYWIAFILISLQFISGAQTSGLIFTNLDQSSNRLQGKLKGEIYYMNYLSNSNYFLQKDWTDGTITLKDGDFFDNIKMRYMAYGDELVAYNDNNRTLFTVDKNTVKWFTFKTKLPSGAIKETKFVNLDSLNIIYNRSFFEELFSGTVQLLVFHQIEQVNVAPYSDASGRILDSEFKLLSLHYLLSETKGIVRISLRNRALYNVYPENKKEIRRQLRKNKISIRNESTAIQAFELLDKSGILK